MPQAPTPPWEAERLVALEKLRVFGTPAEERFDRLTRLACKTFGLPIAVLDLLGADTAWLKSTQGYHKVRAPRATSYCGYTILQENSLVVPDAQQDPRLFDNPYAQNFRFYAGVPLRSAGMPIGAFSVSGYTPRLWTENDTQALYEFARVAEFELRITKLSETQLCLAAENEVRYRPLVDDLTKTWNKTAIIEILGRELRKAAEADVSTGILMLDIDHFKKVNEERGYSAGDTLLQGLAERLRAVLRHSDSLGRYGGEEFVVVLPRCTREDALEIAERVRTAVESKPFGAISATVSVGVTVAAAPSQNHAVLLQAADLALYRAKQRGRNRVESRWTTPSFAALRATK